MAWETLFRTDNNVILLAKFKATERRQPVNSLPDDPTGRPRHPQGLPTKFAATDGREGICGGMSAIWLKNMFNKRDVDCAPDLHSSARIHANSEFFAPINWNQNVLELAGLSIVANHRRPHSDAIDTIMSANGSYYFSTGNHAMAAVKRTSIYYFFNPSYGALRTGDADTFRRLAQELHMAYLMIRRYKILWTLIKVREAS